MRKSPVNHEVSGHKRQGKWIGSYRRGKGQKPQRSRKSVVVGEKEKSFEQQVEQERKEHPWLSQEEAERVVMDHLKEESETQDVSRYRDEYLRMDSDWKYPKVLEDVSEDVWKMALLTERVDPEKNFLKYIDVSYVDAPALDNMRESPEHFRDKKGVKYDVRLLTPDMYFYHCARVHDHWDEKAERRNVNEDLAREYANLMLGGEKFPIPYIDYDYGNQEGRNRARALEIIGVKFVPTLMVESISPE